MHQFLVLWMCVLVLPQILFFVPAGVNADCVSFVPVRVNLHVGVWECFLALRERGFIPSRERELDLYRCQL